MREEETGTLRPNITTIDGFRALTDESHENKGKAFKRLSIFDEFYYY